MRRRPATTWLDFVTPARRAPLAGAALLAAGLASVAAVGLAFERQLAERDRLEAALEASAPPRRRAPGPEAQQVAAEAAAVERELAVPWTRLLAELEAASHDRASSVSLLQVDPDRAKQQVRISAEARTLDDAIAYVKRLQQIEALRYPMLESHERRKDDRQHPLRIKIVAEWRT